MNIENISSFGATIGGGFFVGILIGYALKLQFAKYDDRIALKTFQYSLIYLTGLFIVLLLDHHLLIT